MKKYCTSCGQPSEFITEAPKFCSECGVAFDPTLRARQANTPKAPAPAPVVAETTDEDEDGDEDAPYTGPTSVSTSNVRIEGASRRGEKIGEIAGTESGEPIDRPKGKSYNKKKFLEEFRREASEKSNISID